MLRSDSKLVFAVVGPGSAGRSTVVNACINPSATPDALGQPAAVSNSRQRRTSQSKIYESDQLQLMDTVDLLATRTLSWSRVCAESGVNSVNGILLVVSKNNYIPDGTSTALERLQSEFVHAHMDAADHTVLVITHDDSEEGDGEAWLQNLVEREYDFGVHGEASRIKDLCRGGVIMGSLLSVNDSHRDRFLEGQRNEFRRSLLGAMACHPEKFSLREPNSFESGISGMVKSLVRSLVCFLHCDDSLLPYNPSVRFCERNSGGKLSGSLVWFARVGFVCLVFAVGTGQVIFDGTKNAVTWLKRQVGRGGGQ